MGLRSGGAVDARALRHALGRFATGIAILTSVTPPEDRARRFGMLGAMFGIGFILGPVLGGLLTQNLGWRSIFWINAFCGLAVFALAVSRLAREPRPAGQ